MALVTDPKMKKLVSGSIDRADRDKKDEIAERTDAAEAEPFRLEIGEYTLYAPLTNEKSGFSKWGFCWKDGQEYFIKEFLSPVYPDESIKLETSLRERKIEECVKWFDEKSNIYSTIVSISEKAPALIAPAAFFKRESHFYLVTQKVTEAGMNLEQLSAELDLGQKLVIMKILAFCFSKLAEKNIVHADIKPDNLLIKQTNGGGHIIKIIDFDAAYIATRPPEPDDIQGDMVYYAPETYLYIAEEDIKLTPKIDVFAIAIIFHQLLCGKMPQLEENFTYIYESVLNGVQPKIDDSITGEYRDLLEHMLTLEAADRLSMQEVMDWLIRLDEKYQATPKPAPVPAVTYDPPLRNDIWTNFSDDDLD